jgi:predicted CoA-substrate-specific enzyme activase
VKIGLDNGSTTMKSVVLDESGHILSCSYARHFSQIARKASEMLREISEQFPGLHSVPVAISGSAGMGLAEACGIEFVQEVYATRVAARRLLPQADVIIELGGEDAKILFLDGNTEVRMNGTCAGGTGAFIDQMGSLLRMTPCEMDTYAARHSRIYTIASRCGVFAKSDIQPLLNQGAGKEDLAASIFCAVVNQTVGGLSQGRPIRGRVVYLGGPLTFLPELRRSFDDTLGLTGLCPEHSLYYVAMGAAFCAESRMDLSVLVDTVAHYSARNGYAALEPLFGNRDEYGAFAARHQNASVPTGSLEDCEAPVYLGVDAGSTTVKAVVISEDGTLVDFVYLPNDGNPVALVKDYLSGLYRRRPGLLIAGSAATGYGEDMIRNAFSMDFGLVETQAHFLAARRFMPDVQFVIDIGGQDIKCFKVENGAIDNIYLNEACSSGCGSFLQTFASALGYTIEDFARLGLFAERPVDLGSRCTVFMNSSVKQAQKDGACLEDISAGLSISVVKNALYKVIRPSGREELGRRIVVQGGTFLNDAVLRAFEKELDVQVVRPSVAGVMGAYGAALYAREHAKNQSATLGPEALEQFAHQVRTAHCGLCNNNCLLTVNQFDGGRRFISGNRCERPLTGGKADDSLNLYHDKLSMLASYEPVSGPRGVVGLPMALNMYEMLPFWHRFFTVLGFGVAVSPLSSRQLYLDGQASIPSDTVCFPAKLVHGHIQALIKSGVRTIFYPCMSYNFDEGLGDNHYNCPVVAYYPEVIAASMPELSDTAFIYDYVGVHREKDFPRKMTEILGKFFTGIRYEEVREAGRQAYAEREAYLRRVRERGAGIIAEARRQGKPVIVLAGRPYHIDPEISHGIDRLIAGFGMAVVSEDAVSHLVKPFATGVLNQWTYHARLYAAARYIAGQPDTNLVQLVSFGCGVDAVTTDEVRALLESEGKIYTQIKIDEITNLGAVRIRLRSLFAALENRGGEARG